MRRGSIALTLVVLAGCSKARPLDGCPQGSVLSGAQCLIACTGPGDCLQSERCDPGIGACVPGAVAHDAGLTRDGAWADASEPEKDSEPSKDADEQLLEAGAGEAG